jgi:CRP-like cAMP-binding protein
MPFDDTAFLKLSVDVLQFFTDDQLRKVTAVLDRQTYNKGQTVIFQGEVSRNFYVIRKGRVAVAAKSGKEKADLAELKPGDFFGEMSLLDATAVTATIKATEILMIPHEQFQYLLKENPLLEKTLRDKMAARKQSKADAFTKKEGT